MDEGRRCGVRRPLTKGRWSGRHVFRRMKGRGRQLSFKVTAKYYSRGELQAAGSICHSGRNLRRRKPAYESALTARLVEARLWILLYRTGLFIAFYL